jgi:hypothetical protein
MHGELQAHVFDAVLRKYPGKHRVQTLPLEHSEQKSTIQAAHTVGDPFA